VTVREIGVAPRAVIVVAAMSLVGNVVLAATGHTLLVIVRLAETIGLVLAATEVKAGVIGLTLAVIVTKAHLLGANTVTGPVRLRTRLIEAAKRLTEAVSRPIGVQIRVITAAAKIVRSSERARQAVSTNRMTLTATCSRWNGWKEKVTATAQCSSPTIALPAATSLHQAVEATTMLALG
jgi:hypothetical protein